MRFLNRFYLVATLLPLLLLALVPDLRLPARRLVCFWQNAGENSAYIPTHYYEVKAKDVLKRDPDSLQGNIWAVAHSSFPPDLKRFESGQTGSYSNAKRLAFAELSKRHPESALLLIQTLIQDAGMDGRVAGPFEDDWNVSNAGSASRVPVNSLDPTIIVLNLQLAHRGQKLEPDNSFFDWMEASALFALRLDAEAVKVLINASRKTDFDMHWREFWRASIWAYEANGPLLPEEKVMVGFGTLLPHLSSMRHVTRMALWNAMQKEDAGDVQGALAIEMALARLNLLRSERGFFGIEQICGVSDTARVWKAPQEMHWARAFYANKPRQTSNSLSENISLPSQQFMRYCNSHRRSDLADETAGLTHRLADHQVKRATLRTPDAFTDYMNGGSMTSVSLWWFASLLVVMQLLTAVGLWFLLTIVGPVLPPRNAVVPHLSSRFVFYPLVLGGAASISITALGALFVSQGWAGGVAFCGFPNNNGAQYAQNCSYLALAPTFLLSATIVLWTSARRRNGPAHSVATDQSRREWEQLGFAPDAYEPFRWFWRAQSFLWFRGLPLLALLWSMYALAYWFGWMGKGDWTSFFDPPYGITDTAWIPFCALGGWLLALIGRWRFGMPTSERGVVFAGFLALRRTQAWMIPFSLWLLVITLWCATPSRHSVDTQLQLFMQSENQKVGP